MIPLMAGIGLLCIVPLPAEDSAAPLPRIAARDGRFVEAKTGRVFRPRGVNYIRIRREGGPKGFLWHDTFNPAHYDPDRAERALADLQAHGFNTVRVFIDHMAGAGVAAPEGRDGLSGPFMDNVCDFLRRARAHRVYVIAAMLYTPDNAKYRQKASAPPRRVEGENAPWFNAGHVAARADYMADFAREIKRRDPGLLSTMLAYETENEAYMIATKPPFSLTEGSFEFGRRSYDLASEEDRQRLADDAAVAATDACVNAVRRVDRDALVSVNVFTFRAVGRTGPGHLRRDRSQDPRFPVRPLALARSRAAYLDIHFYPEDDTTLDRDFASIEYDALKAACAKAGKPLIVGEIGAFNFRWKTMPAAVGAMTRSIRRLLDAGFQGFLYWTYDTDEQNDIIWHAKADDSTILKALAGLEAGQTNPRGGQEEKR